MIFSLRGSGFRLSFAFTNQNGSGCLLTTVDDRISDGMEKAGNNSGKGKRKLSKAIWKPFFFKGVCQNHEQKVKLGRKLWKSQRKRDRQ